METTLDTTLLYKRLSDLPDTAETIDVLLRVAREKTNALLSPPKRRRPGTVAKEVVQMLASWGLAVESVGCVNRGTELTLVPLNGPLTVMPRMRPSTRAEITKLNPAKARIYVQEKKSTGSAQFTVSGVSGAGPEFCVFILQEDRLGWIVTREELRTLATFGESLLPEGELRIWWSTRYEDTISVGLSVAKPVTLSIHHRLRLPGGAQTSWRA